MAGNKYKYVFAALLLFLMAWGLSTFTNGQTNLRKYASSLENSLNKYENEIDRLFADAEFIKNALEWNFRAEEMKRITVQPYNLYIYKGDSLLFWNNNEVLPYASDYIIENGKILDRESRVLKLNNGYYHFIKNYFIHPASKELFTLIGLIPVKLDYPLQNQFLQNKFPLASQIPKTIELAFRIDGDMETVKSSKGIPLFYLSSVDKNDLRGNSTIPLILILLACLSLCIFLNSLAAKLGQKYKPFVGVLFLIGAVLLLRGISITADFTAMFHDVSLFNSDGFRSKGLFASAGDVLINSVLVLWLSIFFHQQLSIKNLKQQSIQARTGLAILFYSAIMFGVFMVNQMYRGLLLKTDISFDINNIFSLTQKSFVGLLSLSILMVALFLYTYRVMRVIEQLRLPAKIKASFVIIAIILFTILNILDFDLINLLVILLSLIYILLFSLFIKLRTITFTWLVLWLLFFSGFSSALLYKYNQDKELKTRIQYARELGRDNDPKLESLFFDTQKKIQADQFIKSSFNDFLLIPRNVVVDRIEKLYLSNSYFYNKYNSSVQIYNQSVETQKLKNFDEGFEAKIQSARPTPVTNLYLFRADIGTYQYLAKIPVKAKADTLGFISIEFESKILGTAKTYPELLIEDSLRLLQRPRAYEYAIYDYNVRTSESAKNQFEDVLTYNFSKGKRHHLDAQNGYSYLYYKAGKNRTVVVSKPQNALIRPISLFSYVFCLFLAVLILLVGINYLINVLPNALLVNLSPKPSLRNKIHFSVIAVIIISFIVIGVVNVLYTRADYDDYHSSRLKRKSGAILRAANHEMNLHRRDSAFLPDIKALSKIHKMDINMYGLNGELIESTQPDIYAKGLVSRRMNPEAFFYLNKTNETEYAQSGEQIGAWQFNAAYITLKDSRQQVVAYFGLPYYSGQTDLRDEISEFLGTLLNVYVLLLLIAGFVAVVVANSVTSPLTVIGENLKQIKLGKKNEPLKWDNDDEIGQLIAEYNKMILELEQSADLLAQSERESAWREMAKQVAHEIKNPLTPMKLSIQHLQRAYKTNPQEIESMLEKVTKTLIEQIESLSNIASEFSNFAKMPVARNEKLNLNEMVASVHALFSERPGVNVGLEMIPEDVFVFSDKNQLIRVFNNVLKNAIQAIPDDREGEITVLQYTKNNRVVVKVSDNGIGIPDDRKEKVFVPNFTTKSSGTGLGLAMSKNIIENAGGTIYFNSTEDVGTDFFIELPMLKNH